VKPGQEFVAEWSTGHGGPVWMTIVKSEDQSRLGVGDKGRDMVEDYLREAEQAGSKNLISKLGVMAHHGEAMPGRLKSAAIERKDSKWGARPPPPQFSARGQFSEFREYDPSHLKKIQSFEGTKIKRYEYKSRKYPWLVAVHRFPITFHRPKDVDVARMAIYKPGKYVVQYRWNGYYDCMDVQVLDQDKPTKYPYGQIMQSLQSRLVRIDHCQYVQQHNSDFCSEAYPDPNHCLSNCDRSMATGSENKNTHFCMGVSVLPFRPKVAGLDGSTNLPAACSYLTKPGSRFQLKDDAMLCYGVHPRPKTDVRLNYEISLDPRNPIFYSTCYQRQQAIKFEGLPPPNYNPSYQFMFGDMCTTCGSMKMNAQKGKPARHMVRGRDTVNPGVLTPVWKMTEKCKECDEIDVKADLTPEQNGDKVWGRGSSGRTCSRLQPNGGGVAGYGRSSKGSCAKATCAKFLETPGQRRGKVPVVFDVAHCKALAARDRDCNDAVVWFNGIESTYGGYGPIHYPAQKGPKGSRYTFKQGKVCICVKRSSCCNGCKATRDSKSSPVLFQRSSRNMQKSDIGGESSQPDDAAMHIVVNESSANKTLKPFGGDINSKQSHTKANKMHIDMNDSVLTEMDSDELDDDTMPIDTLPTESNDSDEPAESNDGDEPIDTVLTESSGSDDSDGLAESNDSDEPIGVVPTEIYSDETGSVLLMEEMSEWMKEPVYKMMSEGERILTHDGQEECEQEHFMEFIQMFDNSSSIPGIEFLTRDGVTSALQASAQRHFSLDMLDRESLQAGRRRRRSEIPTAPVGGKCVERRSLKDCAPCLENAQCADGVCDPIMKKCVRDRTQLCSLPIASCKPGSSKCKKSLNTWQKGTCGGSAPAPGRKTPARRRRRRRRRRT